jgi:hypothetical protein
MLSEKLLIFPPPNSSFSPLSVSKKTLPFISFTPANQSMGILKARKNLTEKLISCCLPPSLVQYKKLAFLDGWQGGVLPWQTLAAFLSFLSFFFFFFFAFPLHFSQLFFLYSAPFWSAPPLYADGGWRMKNEKRRKKVLSRLLATYLP